MTKLFVFDLSTRFTCLYFSARVFSTRSIGLTTTDKLKNQKSFVVKPQIRDQKKRRNSRTKERTTERPKEREGKSALKRMKGKKFIHFFVVRRIPFSLGWFDLRLRQHLMTEWVALKSAICKHEPKKTPTQWKEWKNFHPSNHIRLYGRDNYNYLY